MKWKINVFTCCLLFALPIIGFASQDEEVDSGISSRFKALTIAKNIYNYDLLNYKANKEAWAKWQAEHDAVNELKKDQQTKDNEEGQVIIKF